MLIVAVTRVVSIDAHALELVYSALFLVGMVCAACLGRWGIRQLLVFFMIVASLLAVAKAVHAVLDRCSGAYVVQVENGGFPIQ